MLHLSASGLFQISQLYFVVLIFLFFDSHNFLKIKRNAFELDYEAAETLFMIFTVVFSYFSANMHSIVIIFNLTVYKQCKSHTS